MRRFGVPRPLTDGAIMRRISSTIERLRSAQAAQSAPRGDNPGVGLNGLVTNGGNPGNLKSWCYVPNSTDPLPLVVVLHGCTQSAAGYDLGSGWSALAKAHRFAVLFPEQQRANNPNLCFNWFLPDDTRRGSGEGSSKYLARDRDRTGTVRSGLTDKEVERTAILVSPDREHRSRSGFVRQQSFSGRFRDETC